MSQNDTHKQLGIWSGGMICTLDARGPQFDSWHTHFINRTLKSIYDESKRLCALLIIIILLKKEIEYKTNQTICFF